MTPLSLLSLSSFNLKKKKLFHCTNTLNQVSKQQSSNILRICYFKK